MDDLLSLIKIERVMQKYNPSMLTIKITIFMIKNR